MSVAQIAASDWSLVFGTVLGWLLIIIFMVTVQRKLFRLRADFKLLLDAVKLLSDEVSHLKIAEERRFMKEINAGRADDAHSEPAQTTAPPVVPAHLDIPANAVSDPKHWRGRAAQLRVMSDWMNDAKTRATMLKLAQEYDALAERADTPASTSHHQTPRRRFHT
jgi:hypothetical protein